MQLWDHAMFASCKSRKFGANLDPVEINEKFSITFNKGRILPIISPNCQELMGQPAHTMPVKKQFFKR